MKAALITGMLMFSSFAFSQADLLSDFRATCFDVRGRSAGRKEYVHYVKKNCASEMSKFISGLRFTIKDNGTVGGHGGGPIDPDPVHEIELTVLSYTPAKVKVAERMKAIQATTCVSSVVPAQEVVDRRLLNKYSIQALQQAQGDLTRTVVVFMNPNFINSSWPKYNECKNKIFAGLPAYGAGSFVGFGTPGEIDGFLPHIGIRLFK